jgi:hypothetical protein
MLILSQTKPTGGKMFHKISALQNQNNKNPIIMDKNKQAEENIVNYVKRMATQKHTSKTNNL